MPVPYAPPVTLADEERTQLESLARAHSTPQALAFRCKPGQRILYTSAEITDCVPPWNDLGLGLAERYTKMLTSYCVEVDCFLITTARRFLRLFRALRA